MRRTHSTIDSLPADIRAVITAMVVDAVWPEGCNPVDSGGKPTYEDIVLYLASKELSVSRSAIGRWAKGLRVFERMRTAAGLAKQIMADVRDEDASAAQKAAAEIITAQIIDMASSEDLKPKDISMIAGAVRDCSNVAMAADKYRRQQIKSKAEAADKTITEIAKKKKLDPETLKIIREQVYGIVA